MPDAARFEELEQWRQIVCLVRAYAIRKYGADVEGWTLHLTRRREGEREHYEPFPAWFLSPPSSEKQP
jgi:hypothetical protein